MKKGSPIKSKGFVPPTADCTAAHEITANRETLGEHFVLTQQLRHRLLALDFPAFARCVCRLMEVIGYEDAHLTGRREWKGYNRPGGGGYDLEASLPGGIAPRRVVAQVKQYDRLTVHQRSVDELRGACLRAGAAEALLVTLSTFSEVVRSSAASDTSGREIAPVRLMDGEELIGLLIRHRLGVRERGLVKRKLVIDEAFFRSITAPSIPLSDCSPPPHCIPLPQNISQQNISQQRRSQVLNSQILRSLRLIVRISAREPISARGTKNWGSKGAADMKIDL